MILLNSIALDDDVDAFDLFINEVDDDVFILNDLILLLILLLLLSILANIKTSFYLSTLVIQFACRNKALLTCQVFLIYFTAYYGEKQYTATHTNTICKDS
jgi:hypothetical protein